MGAPSEGERPCMVTNEGILQPEELIVSWPQRKSQLSQRENTREFPLSKTHSKEAMPPAFTVAANFWPRQKSMVFSESLHVFFWSRIKN